MITKVKERNLLSLFFNINVMLTAVELDFKRMMNKCQTPFFTILELFL